MSMATNLPQNSGGLHLQGHPSSLTIGTRRPIVKSNSLQNGDHLLQQQQTFHNHNAFTASPHQICGASASLPFHNFGHLASFTSHPPLVSSWQHYQPPSQQLPNYQVIGSGRSSGVLPERQQHLSSPPGFEMGSPDLTSDTRPSNLSAIGSQVCNQVLRLIALNLSYMASFRVTKFHSFYALEMNLIVVLFLSCPRRLSLPQKMIRKGCLLVAPRLRRVPGLLSLLMLK